jgi:uncharacterized protein
MAKLERGQWALVTGASAGIGRAFVQALARRGMNVVLVARDKARLEALASELEASGTSAEVLSADLGQPSDLERVEQRLRSEPRIDLLVNNAGLGYTGSFLDIPVAAAEVQIRVNALAPTRLAHAALTGMRARRRGGVIQVSSLATFTPSLHNGVYSGTKSYLTALSHLLAEELRSAGVTVLVVHPGFTRTEFGQRAGFDSTGVPDFLWQSADDVVEESLRAYESGRSFLVNGFWNRLFAALTRLVPSAWQGRVAGLTARVTPQPPR